MQDIEPFYNWRDHYIASEDPLSPFFEREYNEFEYTSQIYNFYIHPQWDYFGSETLYLKVLFADYDNSFAIIELIAIIGMTLNLPINASAVHDSTIRRLSSYYRLWKYY